jgi:TPR repeat protein
MSVITLVVAMRFAASLHHSIPPQRATASPPTTELVLQMLTGGLRLGKNESNVSNRKEQFTKIYTTTEGETMKALTVTAFFLTLTTIGLAAPATPVGHPGLAAFAAGDYTTAIKIWTPMAENGDANAQANLGIMYFRGLGVDKDIQRAVQLFQSAAAKGNGQAEFQLGLMFQKGVGVQQDYGEAMRWYEAAADQGDPLAGYGIGRLFEEGYGVAQDERAAAVWYRRAAEKGIAPAEYNLSQMIAKGRGGEKKDDVQAYAWCRKAADQGYGKAAAALAMMYAHGTGVEADAEQALFWSDVAARYQEKVSERQRAALVSKLTPEVVARAQQSAGAWKPVLAAAK